MMRSAGILMPLTSLPSPWGVGTLGAEARAFVDFLARAGQTYWQVLPIGPTSYGDSPYQSFSSFAGSPYLIDLDDLCAEGLLKPEEYQGLDWGEDPERVDYGLLYRQRFPVLRQAVRRLRARRLEELAAFCAREADWLDDYALFMALKGRHDGAPWSQWPAPLRRREPAALAAAARELDGELWFWKGVQFLFFRQWEALKARAAEQGVAIIGDLPIYVAEDSADVWADPSQFQMDEALRPTGVAGCPPDGFSADGQRWGNPLFDWEAMKADGYRWWLRRISFQFRFYDVLRIDHFRGFEAYYAIPAGAENAKKGFWKPGPGLDFFRALEAAINASDPEAKAPRLPRHEGAPVRLRQPGRRRPGLSAPQLPRQLRGLCGHPRQRHRPGLAGRGGAGGRGPGPGVPPPGSGGGGELGHDAGRLGQHGGLRRGADAGRAGPGQRGEDEHPLHPGGQLAVAGPARLCRAGAGRPPPPADGAL